MATDPKGLEEAIVEALRQIREPTGKNLIEAGIVVGLEGEGARLVVSCQAPDWPDPIRQRIEREIQAALRGKVPPLEEVVVRWQAAGQSRGPERAANAASALPPPDIKHVIAVGSGKGGVGKSTIAACLAYALKHRGHRVGLMDLDVYGPSIPHMVGLARAKPETVGQRYEPPVMDGIKVMSMGFLVAPEQAVVWRGPMLHKAVRDFLFLVAWGSLDYLIVDLPPGTGDVVLSLSQQLPLTGGVVVCTPQDVALLDARKALNMFQTVKIPCLGVVENMSFFLCPNCAQRTEIFGHGGAQRWAASIGVPFLGAVPINLGLRVAGDTGAVRENFAADNPIREHLFAIADRLVENIEAVGAPATPTLEVV